MKNIEPLLIKTSVAATVLRNISDRQIKKALLALADALQANAPAILKANAKDMACMEKGNPRNDRLLLNEQRIEAIANSIRNISKLPNPSGKLLLEQQLKNGLHLQKQTVPLGVVAAIYESRPNVTFDIAALCLRSQNGCVLKGSKEALHTNEAAVALIKKVYKSQGLPADCILLLRVEREAVEQLFTAVKWVDVIIPRGSDNLIQFVRKNSLIPVIETGAGVCHIYVEKKADIDKAVSIVVNAKTSRPSVCNAVDTVIVDEAIANTFLSALQPHFLRHSVHIYADAKAHRLLKGYAHLHKASTVDFGREFLSLQCAIKVVPNMDFALKHIAQYSTRHSEAIVSENKKQCERFLKEVDAAAVYANASTRFTDGEEFGLGAEMGISTQKLHARGPFALEKLVTEKWIIRGEGQIR